MLKLSYWRTIAALCLALVVSACGGAGSSASAPSNFKVTPGNGQVIITWQADAGVDYWMMYAATAAAIDIKNPPPGHIWATNITSPYVVSGLTNGTTYSFAINGRTSGGPGGPQTASQSAAPRYAGSTWVTGTGTNPLGTGDMRGVTYGTASDTTVNYLAVGSGGKIYKGLEGVSQGLTGMVWSAVTPSTALATDFRATTYAFGKFIAIGANSGANNIVSSADLATWTAANWTPPALPVGAGLNAVASNGTILVAVGDGGIAFSTADGATWTPVTTGTASNLYGLTYSATYGWVAVGQAGVLLTSADLLTWTSQSSNAGGNDLNSITVTSGNIFVAVGNSGTIVTSNNSTAWTAQTLATAPHLFAASTDSAQFLAVGQSGKVYTSLDAISWTPITQSSATTDLMAIIGSTSKYMVVGKTGANMSSIN